MAKLSYFETLMRRNVADWIADVQGNDGSVGETDVRSYIRKTWPDTPRKSADIIVSTFSFSGMH